MACIVLVINCILQRSCANAFVTFQTRKHSLSTIHPRKSSTSQSCELSWRVKDCSCRHQESDDANDEAMCPHIDANWTDYEEGELKAQEDVADEKKKERI